MTENTNFLKIKVGLVLKSEDTVFIDNNCIPTHSAKFNQKIYDKEEEIRSKIILQINERIGLHNWATVFGEIHPISPRYIVDIFAENVNDYNSIIDILQEQIPEITFLPFHKGTILDYTKGII